MSRKYSQLVARELYKQPAEALGALGLVVAASAFVVSLLMSKVGGAETRGQMALVLQVSYILWPVAALGVDRMMLRNSSGVRRPPGYLHVIASCVIVVAAVLLGVPWTVAASMGAVSLWHAHLALMRGDALARRAVVWYVIVATSLQLWLVGGAVVIWLSGASGSGPWLLLYSLPGLAAAVGALHPGAASPQSSLRGQLGEARASLPLGFSAMLGAVGFRADRLIMPAIMGVTPLGVYLSAATPLELVAGFSAQRADARVSRIAGASGFRHSLRSVLREAGWEMVKFAPLVIAVSLLTDLVVLPWLGPDFAEGSEVVPWMALAAMLIVLYRTTNAFNLGSQRPRSASLPEVFAGIVSIPIYWFAIATHGMTGAAVGSCLVYLLAFLSSMIVIFHNSRGRERGASAG